MGLKQKFVIWVLCLQPNIAPFREVIFMLLPKPPKPEKKPPKPISRVKVERSGGVDTSGFAFSKPVVEPKIKKPLPRKRKSTPKRSTLTDGRCWLCDGTRDLELHEIFFGRKNHDLSIHYGLVVHLCGESCHRLGASSVHQCGDTDRRLKKYGQEKFNEFYPELDFLKIFGRNYL
jgi:hypothetical protein